MLIYVSSTANTVFDGAVMRGEWQLYRQAMQRRQTIWQVKFAMLRILHYVLSHWGFVVMMWVDWITA